MRRKATQNSSDDVLRILLVDDARIILDRLVRALDEIDRIQIIGTCEDGANAIERVDALKPDVVILDISLRDSNGWDVLRYIVTNNPQTDVYMFSNDASSTAKKRFLLGGAKEFFDKSLDFGSLLAEIRQRAAKPKPQNPGASN